MSPLFSQRIRLQLYLVAWGLAGALLSALLHILLGLNWSSAAALALPLALLAVPISLSSWYFCRVMPLTRTSAVQVIGTTILSAVVTAALWAAVGQLWWRALALLGLPVTDIAVASLMAVLVGFGALAYVLSVTVTYLLLAFEDATEAEQRMLKSELVAREAELRALRAQVDPHFLFNSLNSIVALIGADPQRARAMGQLLADFLRESLALGGANRIPLEREIGLIRKYLEIERARFGRRLDVAIDVAPDAAVVPVPPLILQPLVENAVRHGIATLVEGGRVAVRASIAGDRLVLAVTNPRDPEAVARRGAGLGIEIVRRRLATTFGDDAALAIESAPSEFAATMTLPRTEER
jgi:two-component system, LytTR family, sensor histidine kinase AlgZ